MSIATVYMRLPLGRRFERMNHTRPFLRFVALTTVAALTLAVAAGCADPNENVRRPASGPAAENPAAAGAGDVIPAIGGAGNGGGVSGGGAGVGSAGQGAR